MTDEQLRDAMKELALQLRETDERRYELAACRDALIVAAAGRGWTYREMARLVDITAPRAFQIVNR